MLHKRFIYRQLTRSWSQAVLFVLCVVLSMVILVALNGFAESVDRLMQADARTLQGGDVIIRSRLAISEPLVRAVGDLRRAGVADSVSTHEFYTMARNPGTDGSLLARVKAVAPGYPLYGRIELASKRPFADVLTAGRVVVEQGVLDRLHMQVGDRISIGQAVLTVGGVVLSEPDRPVSVFAFGPRIFVAAADLGSLDLLGKGSRIRYRILLKVKDQTPPAEIARRLAAVAVADQEQVDTFRTARSRMKQFFDNFFFFLNLVGTFTLVLAGIGIYSAITAFLKEKEKTIAVLKTLGAGARFVTTQYLCVLFLLGLIGTVCGMGAGFWLEYRLPRLFSGLLPPTFQPVVSWRAVGQGLGLGLVIVSLFAFLPVYRLRDIKPAAILRKEPVRFRHGAVTYAVVLAILCFFAALVVEKMEDVKTGGYFILGIVGLIGVTGLITGPVLWLLKRMPVKRLVVRQALKGLFRPGNATRAVIVTMTASLTFIFAIYLVEQNLNETYIRSYPADAPNLFFLDIQPDQRASFSRTIGTGTTFYPLIRARLLAVNDRTVDRSREHRRRGDNLARTFNLTYRHHLLDDEIIVAGGQLFADGFDGIPVSVLDTAAEMADPEMVVGDRLTFRIQGVPLTATVTSIRSRVRETLSPFFYFVFPDHVLREAPQTIFAAVRVPAARISGLQNRVVAAFPHVTVIDVTASAQKIAGTLHRLSAIVRFFTLFSLVAGVLLIVSSVYATRWARMQEAVYYKVLGAGGGFVLRVFALENFFLGLISGLLALLLSQAACWVVCRQFLHIAYRPFAGASALLIALAVFVAVAAGLLPSVPILRQKPMGFLKAQTDD